MTRRQTILGILCDESSMAAVETLEQGIDGPRLRTRAWSTRASDVRTVQGERIAIDTAHDGRELGEIVALLRRGPNLWAVGHVNEDVHPAVRVRVADDTVTVPTPLYWSALRDSRLDDSDIVLRGWR
jgi:hypothetical protein